MAVKLHGPEINISNGNGLVGAAAGLANGGFAVSYLLFSTGLFAYNLVTYDGFGQPVAGPKNLGTPNGGVSSGNGGIAELSNASLAAIFSKSGPAIGNSIDVGLTVLPANLGSQFGPINPGTNPYGFEYSPAIAARPGGGFLVAWQDDNSIYGRPGENVIVQAFKNDGSPRSGGPIVASRAATSAGDQGQPDISALSSGRYVVVWQDDSGLDGSGSGIRGRFFAADGTAAGKEFAVNKATASNQTNPKVAALAGGGFAVVWESGSDLYVRTFDKNGKGLSLDTHVALKEDGTQSAPDIAGLPDGGFLVTWTTNAAGGTGGGDGSGKSIKARAFDRDASPRTLELLVNDITTGDQHTPVATTLADGRVLIAWTDESHVGGVDYPVTRAQIVDARTKAVVVKGTAGDDKYVGSRFADKIAGLQGADDIRGSAGGDILDGGKGKDGLRGQYGADTLIGGAGADQLFGGPGADRFVLKAASDSKPGSANRDVIMDFRHGEHDRIDLSAIDANTKIGGNQQFNFIGGQGFHHKAGELRFAGNLLQGDVNGDGKADFQIGLPGVAGLVAGPGGDFVL